MALRLSAAFAVLMVILMGIGQLGLGRMRDINDTLSNITGGQLAKLQLPQEALTFSTCNDRISMNIFLVMDRALMDLLLSAMAENNKKISELLAEIGRSCESEKEKQLLAAIARARRSYVESSLRALHLLVDEGERDEAAAVMVNEMLLAPLKYHARGEFGQFQKNQVDTTAKKPNIDYVRARALTSLLILLALVVAFAIALSARIDSQQELQRLNADLDNRVMQRPRELTDTSNQLTDEVRDRQLVDNNYRKEGACRQSIEHALRRSEERNRMAMDAAKIGYWDLDVINDEHVWSDTCKALLGLAPDSAAGYQVLMNRVHPDDRATMMKEINAALQEKRDYVCEFRVVWSDGSSKWRVSKGRGFYDNTGQPTRMTGITMDIDERKRAEERVNLQAAALEAAANAIVITDQKGRILRANRAFSDLTGYATEEAQGRDPRLLKSGKQSKEFYADLWQTITSGNVWHGELINRRKDGSLYTEEQTITPVRSGGGEITHFVAVKQDITERRNAEETLLFKTALLEAQAETMIDGILVVDESDHIVLANKQFGLHFGVPDELLSTGDDVIVRQYVRDKVEDPDGFVERVKYLNGHPNERSRDELRFKNGNTFDRYSSPLVDPKGRYRGRIWYFRDITDRKAAEAQIRALAYYDALTGLPNRILLQDRLAQALATASRHQEKAAVFFLDLDRFKVINDSLGHSVGDCLLREVAARLKRQTREQDTVARLGGDEFVVVVSGVRQISDSVVAAERIVNAMTGEFVIQAHSLNVSCSLGISIFPDDGRDSETLLKHADAAMYSAKDNGRNNLQFFRQEMNAQSMQRLTLANSMRRALQNEEFFLMYQPQQDIVSGQISGVEALIRWQHPELGLVSPAEFIPAAENSGLIIPIGEWVLQTACAQARQWQDEGLLAAPMAVNVSAVQFRHRGFLELVSRVLYETGLPPQYLELELTESLILFDAEVMLSMLKKLKEMGVRLAIDDFGTGYSSFSYLRHFSVHKLKIDRSFVQDVSLDSDDAAITGAIISVAKSLNLKVIAEGVETTEQLSFFREHHCDEIQGYYFSKPLLADECAEKIRRTTQQASVKSNAESDPMLADAAGGQ
jgi:diguanylate cyclase (GGDEF)-like protein/PAS domain S-box-containing protein